MKITLDPKLTGDPKYIATGASGRGAWINLLLWCAEQENGGVIPGATSWSDEAWGMLGVFKGDLLRASSLVMFAETDVHIWGYPIEQEEYLRRARALGRKGGLAKAEHRVNKSRVPDRDPTRDPTEFPENLKTDEFMQTWSEWLNYRRMRKLAAYKPRSVDKQLAELSEWGHDEAIRSINDSIRQQWQGLFPPKSSAAGGRKASFA